ncbi:uncharacterized protein LOC134225623 isoform X2 [Armigeres subalbatus]
MAKVLLKLEPSEQEVSEIFHHMLLSDRKYQHVLFRGEDDEHDVLPTILEKFKLNLESLCIKSYYESMLTVSLGYLQKLFCCLTMLKELRIQTMVDYEDDAFDVPDKIELSKMPCLRVLYLETSSLEAACFDWIKIAPHLERLYLPQSSTCSNFKALMSFYGPQLSSLGISMGGDRSCCVGETKLDFPKVRKLTIVCWTGIGLTPTARLIKSFTNLHELSLGHHISEETLSMLAESHPSLVVLRLFDTLPENGWQIISKLPNLEQLYLMRMTIELNQLTQANCFEKVQQLSLKKVEVKQMDDFFALIHVKMPHITSLEIADIGAKQISSACNQLCNLQRLNVVWIEDYISSEIFDDLHRCTNLSELRLSSHDYQKAFSWTWFPRCPSVRKLTMYFPQLTDFCPSGTDNKEWTAFSDCFPSLTRLEIAKCQLPPTTIESIQMLLLNCEIRHVSERGPFQADHDDGIMQFRDGI